ncbi:hypothetical protein LP415_13865 [Polaromonas sp. P1(28)-8]|nr:hypothetical protein LP415_13865 [Polaromonas sp. P1(28)-8]
MAEKKIAKPSFRSLRLKAIAEAVKRGDKNHNIWTVYSTKNQKDCVLIGDVEYLNFQWMEGDPKILSFSVDSDLYIADQDESNGATYPDAIAIYRDGEIEWREAKAGEGEEGSLRDQRQRAIQERITRDLQYQYLRVTPELIKKHWQFICNWRRATAFCSAVRHLNIQQYEDEVCALVSARKSMALSEIVAEYAPDEHSQVVAALLKLTQQGRVLSDLNKLALGPRTTLEAP